MGFEEKDTDQRKGNDVSGVTRETIGARGLTLERHCDEGAGDTK